MRITQNEVVRIRKVLKCRGLKYVGFLKEKASIKCTTPEEYLSPMVFTNNPGPDRIQYPIIGYSCITGAYSVYSLDYLKNNYLLIYPRTFRRRYMSIVKNL